MTLRTNIYSYYEEAALSRAVDEIVQACQELSRVNFDYVGERELRRAQRHIVFRKHQKGACSMSVKTEVEVVVDGREGRLLGAHPLPSWRVRVVRRDGKKSETLAPRVAAEVEGL
jgi:hypothetical protein